MLLENILTSLNIIYSLKRQMFVCTMVRQFIVRMFKPNYNQVIINMQIGLNFFVISVIL